MNIIDLIQQKVREAVTGLVPDPEPYVAMVKQTQDARHGDYQANCAMSLAKVLGKKPRDVAQEIVQRLPLGDLLQPPEVAGPGFINLRLRNDWIAARLQEMARDERLGVKAAVPPQTFVIDYSSPNVAKPMHVGHLRSTIIGDSLARLLRFLGHRVIADNHLGDWGTQFGMLLYGYKHFRDEAALRADPVREMLRLYRRVRELIKPAEEEEEDKGKKKGKPGELPKQQYTEAEKAQAREVQETVREETARLHSGDAENVRLWQMFMPWCLEEINQAYRRLDIHFDCTLGESWYNPRLPTVVDDVRKKGIATESRGALVIFFPGEEHPDIVRKSDGAFTYMTTDLATIQHRMETWKPHAILYVVDSRQARHFRHLFAAARRWGYDHVALEHISFGSVLGKDGKPLKTREGEVAELAMLLDEAMREADSQYEVSKKGRLERGEDVPDISGEERQRLVEAVGVGAVKYADLSQNRTSDYTFDLDKMLAMEGNTATYMQYAYVRNRGIFRKGGETVERFRTNPPLPSLETPYERALGLALLRFEEALTTAAAEYQPSAITSYLWDLAKNYSGFFQNCPVLKAETPELRDSRLLLCDLAARVIQCGLSLLGIRTVERM